MTDRSRVHHVAGLVRPENFHGAISRMSQTLRTAFYGPFDRADIGLRVAISMDAGIELVTPLGDAEDNRFNKLLEARGEHWMSVVVAVRDLDDVCKRLGELGHEPLDILRNIPGEFPPGGHPYADCFSRLDEAVFDPAAFGGLAVVVAAIEEREIESVALKESATSWSGTSARIREKKPGVDQGMLDEVAIQQTLNRYTDGACRADLPQVLSVFTPDAIFESPGVRLEGHAAMEAAMAAFVAEFAYFVQLSSPALITIDGDTVAARSVIRECGKFADADEAMETLGTYRDELIRTEEGWKIARRTFQQAGTHSYPLSPTANMPGAGPER